MGVGLVFCLSSPPASAFSRLGASPPVSGNESFPCESFVKGVLGCEDAVVETRVQFPCKRGVISMDEAYELREPF